MLSTSLPIPFMASLPDDVIISLWKQTKNNTANKRTERVLIWPKRTGLYAKPNIRPPQLSVQGAGAPEWLKSGTASLWQGECAAGMRGSGTRCEGHVKPSVLDKFMCDCNSSPSCDSNVMITEAVTEKLESHADYFRKHWFREHRSVHVESGYGYLTSVDSF